MALGVNEGDRDARNRVGGRGEGGYGTVLERALMLMSEVEMNLRHIWQKITSLL